ncbi:MAG: lysylphosphatidylglycerol synthase transmembrane domain-containing protein [Bacteroidota bacterium]|nr:lysylphosphatidylglycerol synthase transmembrane domain-containing protein [Bacteroidota bacterium]
MKAINIPSKLKTSLQIAFFFLLAVFFVWWFVSKMTKEEISEMFASFRGANYFLVVLAILISCLSVYIRALRWKMLLKALNYKATTTSLFFAIMSCYLTNLTIPRMGEVVRSTLISRKYNFSFDKTLGTIITERAVDLLLFVIIFVIAFLLEYNIFQSYLEDKFNIDFSHYTHLIFYLGIVVLFSIVLFFLLRKKIRQNIVYKKVIGFVLGIWQGMKTVFQLEKPFLFIFYSLLIWFLWILGTWVVFLCLEPSAVLGLKEAMTVTVLGSIGMMITPGGIGLYPSIFAQAINIFRIDLAIGYALGWISWFVSQASTLLLGPIGFLLFTNKNKKTNDRASKG